MQNKPLGTYTLRRLFPSLSEDEIRLFEKNSNLIHLKKGQNLFISGDKPRAIYGVANGCLKIIREGSEGESIITQIARAGSIVGIREIFGEFQYNRTSIALKASEVFSIDSSTMLSFMHKKPSIALQFMKILCTQIDQMEKRIESDVHKPAKNKISSVILDLFHLFSENGSKEFEPPCNRRDIAELAGVTPETVSRCLALLKESNIIKTKGNVFQIIDLNALHNEAEER